jgi:WD40 repeat protein
VQAPHDLICGNWGGGQVEWNRNGNWLLSASRDGSLRVTELRTLSDLVVWQGGLRDVLCAAWHPFHEDLAVSGSVEGTLAYWLTSSREPQVPPSYRLSVPLCLPSYRLSAPLCLPLYRLSAPL